MTPRPDKPIQDLKLPICPTPRAGDEISWYSGAAPMHGILLGHALDGQPVVFSEFGNAYRLPSFDYLRLRDPDNRLGPNWERLGHQAQIKSPAPDELEEFDRLLSQRTPPGPQYFDLISEIWARGYEVFLVGGTVRDVLCRASTNDVDVVTAMPLQRAIPLLKSMYRTQPSISPENGFVRLGGSPGSGDPFIDLKMFTHSDLGTANAMFGNQFDLDLEHRDFACNAVYYDPINQALIDPSGRGITDAENRQLCIVCNTSRRAPFFLAQICIRFFKFLGQGFSPTIGTIEKVRVDFIPTLPAMRRSVRTQYVRTQLLSKKPKDEHEEILLQFQDRMVSFGASDTWEQYFAPFVQEILE